MKLHPLVKNLMREIKRTAARFLSIFAICALGTAFFAGLRATGPDMKEAGDALFQSSYMSDVTVLCSKGLSAEDIDALRDMPDVELVRPGLYVDAMLLHGEDELNLCVRSLPIKEREEKTGGFVSMRAKYDIDPAPEGEMNELELSQGRMPLDDTEVLLDAMLLEEYPIELGEWVEFIGKSGIVRLRVVGFGHSPKYTGIYERGTSSIGNGRSNGFAYASGNAVMRLSNKLPAAALLAPTYTVAEIRIENPEGYSAFGEAYKARVSAVIDSIEAYGKTREGEWYVDGRSANPGYDDYESNTERIGNVGKVFPVIFFVVAALVSLTTMTRMVEDERIEMGTLKALGYGTGTIMAKYFLYAMLSCIAGGLAGCLVGFWLLPTVILKAYSIMYRIPDIHTPFRFDIAAVAIFASCLSTGVATWAASGAALREVPSSLMRPKAPKAGKRILLEYIAPVWKCMRFTSKVTARNIFRYKKRFFMSVIGIAGSCSLLVTGFGLNDSIFGITEKQFNGIWHMDLQAYTYETMGLAELQSIVEKSKAYEWIDSVVYCIDSNSDAKSGELRMSNVHILGVENEAALCDKINLTDGARKCSLRNDGAIITKKLADTFSVKSGDTLNIVRDGSSYDIHVTDVVDNYVFHYVYMTAAYYAQIFGEGMDYNGCLISLREGISKEQTDAAVKGLLEDQRMYTVRSLKDSMSDMEKTLGVLNYIVLVLIVGAALLTLVVMVNLTNINIEERKREMATLRVLGFYDKEMYDYLFRENNILSAIGAAAGLVLGRFMHEFIIQTCEVDIVMFIRQADTKSYVYSFILTIIFSLLVNLIMRRKVRQIDMVESLKSAE